MATKKRKASEIELDRSFNAGFGLAVAALARDHLDPYTAVEIMLNNGVKLSDLKSAGLTDFDCEPLRERYEYCSKREEVSQQ